MDTQDCVIFDLDGTLTDCRHRLHHVRKTPPDWPAFFAGCVDDPPHEYVLELNRMVAQAAKHRYDETGAAPVVFICSGRPDSHRAETERWLADHNVFYWQLLMREAGDHQSDVSLKRDTLTAIRGQGYEPLFAVDDRPSVVAMWREEGVPCLAVDDREWRVAQSHLYTSDQEGKTLLTILVGPTQAGKDTWLKLGRSLWALLAVREGQPGAEKLSNYHGIASSHVLSSDQLRRDLHGGEYVYDPEENRRVFATMHDIARARLAGGLPTVLNATHLRRKERMTAVELAPPGTRVRYVVIDRPLDEKLETRREEIPEDVVRKHDHDFKSQLEEILRGDGLENVDVLDVRSMWSKS